MWSQKLFFICHLPFLLHLSEHKASLLTVVHSVMCCSDDIDSTETRASHLLKDVASASLPGAVILGPEPHTSI